MIVLLAVALAVSLVLAGFGLAFRRVLLPRGGDATLYDAGVLGAVGVMGLAGLLQFAAPLETMTLPVAAVGLACLVAFRRDVRRDGVVLFALAAVVMAGWGVRIGLFHYDTGLYHLQNILHLREEPFVFGLGNLHQRFGYNCLWFALAAVAGSPPFEVTGAVACNLVLFAFVSAAIGARSVRALNEGRWACGLFGVGALVVLFALPPARHLAGTPNTDLPTTTLVLYVFHLGVSFVETLGRDEARRDGWFALAILAAAAVPAIKLSQGLVTGVPAVMLFASVPPRAWGRVVWSRPVLAAAALLTLTVTRGFLTSGCLAFPSAVTCVGGLPWSVGADVAANDYLWMKGWARRSGVDPAIVMSSWDWFPDWLDATLHDHLVRAALGLEALGLLGGVVSLVRPAAGKRRWAVLGLVAVAHAGVAFWFLTAPLLRYAEGFIAATALTTFALLPPYAAMANRVKGIRIPAGTAALVVAAFLAVVAVRSVLAVPLAAITRPWPVVPEVALDDWTTRQGLTIHSPVSGDQCWGAPRPCTPVRNPDLTRDRIGPWDLWRRANN